MYNSTNYIIESFLLNDKDISVNLEKFENKKINKLLIMGYSGSGKTTIGEYLSDKYNTKWRSIDSMHYRIWKKYFKNKEKPEKIKQQQLRKLVEKSTIDLLKNNERWIIEGVDLLEIYYKYPKYRNLILDQSIILLGKSGLKSGIHAGIRNREGGGGWMELFWMSNINRNLGPKLKLFRKDLVKKYKDDIKLFKVPKL